MWECECSEYGPLWITNTLQCWQAPGELPDLEQLQPEQGQIWFRSRPWINLRVHIRMHLFYLPDEVTGHKISKWLINPWVQRWHHQTEVNLQLLCWASWYIKSWHLVKPLPVDIMWRGCCVPNAKRCKSLGPMLNKKSKDQRQKWLPPLVQSE